MDVRHKHDKPKWNLLYFIINARLKLLECHLVHPSVAIAIKSNLKRFIAVLKKISPDGSFWFLRITEVIGRVRHTIWLIANHNSSLFWTVLVPDTLSDALWTPLQDCNGQGCECRKHESNVKVTPPVTQGEATTDSSMMLHLQIRSKTPI